MADRKLTGRQQRFVDAYQASGNAIDAARKAGYSDPNKGRQMVRKGNVAFALAALHKRNQRAKIADINERHEFLSTIQRDAKADVGHRIKACEILMRANGEFASVAIVPPAGGGAAIVTPGADGEPPVITVYMPGNGRDAGR